MYIENMSACVKCLVNGQNKYGINTIQISGLPDGQYILNLKKDHVKIPITVHGGWNWDIAPDFILKQRTMVRKPAQFSDPILIQNVSMKNVPIELEDGSSKTVQNIRVDL
mmetsp:Transcript_9907/g.9759  ORF Transcript_9907/g.9759 Transcript_9907/m.9759 type:complete len:110 (+) Transcript_9907:2203-2532(+)